MEKSKLVPMIIHILIIYTCCMIPITILTKGYLPHDDALRHVAKVISGKEWNEILILRPEIQMDSHPGWHKILELIYRLTDLNPRGLVMLSVVILFIWFSIIPISYFKHPESWLISLLIISMSDFATLHRLFLGRPYIFTMSWVVFISFFWKQLRENSVKLKAWIIFLMYSVASTYIHCNWPVFVLPLFCFILAGERKVAINLSLILVAAILIGACLTGHPLLFLKQTAFHGYIALTQNINQDSLVTEFHVGKGIPELIIAVILIFFTKILQNKAELNIISNPIFLIAAIGYVLQFCVIRFWYDLGFPALSIWIAVEIEEILKNRLDYSWKRVGIVFALCISFYLFVTSDYKNRWSTEWNKNFISYENPEFREWMPENGCTIYIYDMSIFFKNFYKNPHAPWRYILGFEPTMMPKEDFETYKNIILTRGSPESFEPWIKKMTPKDRFLILQPESIKPEIPSLEWHYIPDIWIGKKIKSP